MELPHCFSPFCGAMASYVLGVDVGTTSVRSIVWDKKGNARAQAQMTSAVRQTSTGDATCDPEAVFGALVEVYCI